MVPYMWVDASYGGEGNWDEDPDYTITLEPCEVVYLHVHASGFNFPPDAGGLAGFGFDAYFDPEQLQLTSGTEVNLADWPEGGVFYSNEYGELVMWGDADPDGEAMTDGSYLLATIELHCILPGVSDLVFDGGWWTDEYGDGFPELSVEFINTPIPPAVLLLGSGLLGLVGFRLRRMK
jgi:hypothetical protein